MEMETEKSVAIMSIWGKKSPNEWDKLKGRVQGDIKEMQRDKVCQRVEGKGHLKSSSTKHNLSEHLWPAPRMCIHQSTIWNIHFFCPRHRVYFCWGQATKETCLCESQHSAKHWKASSEGSGRARRRNVAVLSEGTNMALKRCGGDKYRKEVAACIPVVVGPERIELCWDVHGVRAN